jgi:Histidine acid phosphatase.
MHMLDPSGNNEVKVELESCKHEVNNHLQKDFDIDKVPQEELEAAVGPDQLTSLRKALGDVKNPRKTLFAIRDTIGELLDQLDEMLNVMASDVENTHEGGEGLVGEDDDDEALSGIKLYKGETLLELTERWRLLHIKLYDEDKDEFDLSRVPDVHDNVRFDMLHNPHLGLTATLEKLYKLAKVMADCVVPQEYGRSIEEKRSIGNKMCHALLDKIKYDLIIARTDNQVDMRYMINMDYSADLPINTMGRRIRTRLYFTSESHLHTLLNVLRFPSKAPGAKKSPLSRRGVSIISSAPELCYLTQVIIRLFENKAKDANDPKRFRIEILFSPGATATPLHVSEMKRDEDASRFDTEPLQLISSDYLTCQEVEDYFSQSIREGKPRDDESEICSAIPSPIQSDAKITDESKGKQKEKNIEAKEDSTQIPKDSLLENGESKVNNRTVTIAENKNVEFEPETFTHSDDTPCETIPSEKEMHVKEGESGDESRIEVWKLHTMTKILSKQFFWTSIATVSFVFGIGFIILSREVVEKDFKTKRWTRR